MKSTGMKPSKLRMVLASILVMLIVLGIVVFLLAYHQITLYSKDTRQTASDARDSNSKVQRLVATKAQLEDNAAVVDRASQLVSQSQYYKYQDQIIQDINSYGMRAGVSIDSITFENAAAVATAATAATAPPAGVKTTTAIVNIKNPVNYYRFLSFVHSIEQSLFRMSILNVTMTKSTSPDDLKKDPNAITCDPLNIEVYIK